MPETKKLKRVPVWQTSDGKTFDIKAEAEKRQAEINIAAFLHAAVDHDTAVKVVELIKSDLDGFRDVAAPLLRKPRAKPEEKEEAGDRRVPRNARAA